MDGDTVCMYVMYVNAFFDGIGGKLRCRPGQFRNHPTYLLMQPCQGKPGLSWDISPVKRTPQAPVIMAEAPFGLMLVIVIVTPPRPEANAPRA